MTVDYVEAFHLLDWDNSISLVPEYEHSYERHLNALVESESDDNKKTALLMLKKASSLELGHSESVNSPFTKGLYSGTRTPISFTEEELVFYSDVLPQIHDTWLKSRLSDILWLWTKQRRKPEWARQAIDSYTLVDLNADLWLAYQDKHWERAIRLCLQLRDFNRLKEITSKLEKQIFLDHGSHKFYVLWLSKLLVKTGCIPDNQDGFIKRIFFLANQLSEERDYYAARMYMELVIQVSVRSTDKSIWLDALVSYAESFEQEGDSRLSDSAMVANSFYEQSIEAYRKVPKKYREDRHVESHISKLKHKIADSGSKMLDEMGTFEIPMPDVTDLVTGARDHVSGKVDTRKALLYFCGLGKAGSDMNTMRVEAEKTLNASAFKSLVSTINTARDGRVIGRNNATTPNSGNLSAIQKQLIENYLFNVNFLVGTAILPALSKLIEEHSFSRELLESMCFHSPLVPNGREKTLGLALWFGFEHDFSASIHLLCPQLEHIVRMQLKNAEEHTTTIEKGIEHEIGLSSLADKEKFVEIFGESGAFELKALFTESLGCNLRNEVAHGLLSDDDGQNYFSVYAWWYVLQMICHSLIKIE